MDNFRPDHIYYDVDRGVYLRNGRTSVFIHNRVLIGDTPDPNCLVGFVMPRDATAAVKKCAVLMKTADAMSTDGVTIYSHEVLETSARQLLMGRKKLVKFVTQQSYTDFVSKVIHLHKKNIGRESTNVTPLMIVKCTENFLGIHHYLFIHVLDANRVTIDACTDEQFERVKELCSEIFLLMVEPILRDTLFEAHNTPSFLCYDSFPGVPDSVFAMVIESDLGRSLVDLFDTIKPKFAAIGLSPPNVSFCRDPCNPI